jgi:ribosomal-protein-alanine N-acetyltransferase
MNTFFNDDVFGNFPVMESERLYFREFNMMDAMDMFRIRSDERVLAYMDSPKHESVDASRKLIFLLITSFRDKTGITWAMTEKSRNELIGYFGFWRLMKEHCRAEIGYVLRPEFWGKGFMSETFGVLLDFGFSKLNLHSVEANVNPLNKNSIKLLVKSGFRQEAHFRENFLFEGKFYDSLIFSLLAPDFQKNAKRGI